VRHGDRLWPQSTPATSSPLDTVVLEVGTLVDVRNRFDDTWTPGFAVTELGTDNCRIRRVTDDTALPVWFSTEDIRPTPAP
jgi:hypothetical protein